MSVCKFSFRHVQVTAFHAVNLDWLHGIEEMMGSLVPHPCMALSSEASHAKRG